MDPMSGFGLACNVFTVVDFSVKVVAKSREMYENGAVSEMQSLQVIVEDLKKSTAELSRSIADDAGKLRRENELQALCDNCNAEAQKLLAKMERLTGEKEKSLKNISKAIKLVWGKDELDATVRRFESYQAQINTRLLIEMRSFDQKFDQQLTDILRIVAQDRGNMLTVPVFERQMDLLSQELNRIHDVVASRASFAQTGGDGASQALEPPVRTSNLLSDYPRTWEAFVQGDINFLREELEENPSWVRYRDGDGQTPLHIAAGKEDLKLTNFLMRKGATVNAEDNYMRTPLHYATMQNSTALVRAMLTNGASASIEDEDGQPPIFYAQPNSEIHWLLLHGTATEMRDTKGRTALCQFSRLGATSVVRGLLARGANVESLGPNNWTALHEAAHCGHLETCAALLDAGAPVDALSSNRDTPLFFAGQGGHTAIIELLLSHGANINHVQGNDVTTICEAALFEHVEAVELLIDRGANAQHGSTFHPLLRAASRNNVAILKLLLDRAHVKINQRSWQQKTALIEAAFLGHRKAARLLLERGADLRMRDEFGRTAFFCAVERDDLSLTELLLARDGGPGGVLNVRNQQGVSPRGYAVQNGLKQMAKFLEQRGASL